MTAVFGHGRLRLYLLGVLAERPRHGYELIRLLERRFLGRYAPSAGTVYPRLQRMEADGLVRHAVAGGRKVYEITDAGRTELTARAAELAALEGGIDASVADLRTRVVERPGTGQAELAELERRAAAILDEVRRLARRGAGSAANVRAAGVALEIALDQVRRLLR
jgi:DNA-binding PadR family transcriptional regulator